MHSYSVHPYLYIQYLASQILSFITYLSIHIATVSEGGSFVCEMTVEKGRGYNTASKNKKDNQDISVLPIDSIFTPVRKVNYLVIWFESNTF